MRASKHQPGKLKQINFVKAGEKIQRKRREKTNLLSFADDWQLTVDLETQLKFPRHIAVTSLRPDLILHSDNTKQCIIWELTVPWEEYITFANERKRSKFQKLVEQCQQKSWKIHYDPVEVGCRGFAGQSLGRALAKIGIVGAARVRALKDITNTVLNHFIYFMYLFIFFFFLIFFFNNPFFLFFYFFSSLYTGYGPLRFKVIYLPAVTSSFS